MVDISDKSSRSGIQVISRAAKILRVIKENPAGISLGKIASQVGLARSTVQRITSALAEEGFVSAHPDGQGLRLGPELNALAGGAQFNVVEQCRLLLSELTQKTGETADLSVMRGLGMTFLDQVPGIHRLTTVSRVGEVFPLTTTANGRACLAELPEDQAMKLVRDEWERQGTDGEMNAFLAVLRDVRSSGLSYDLDEHSDGICAIGIAFRDWGGELHAISVPMPTTRYDRVKADVENAIRETRSSIEKAFHSSS